MLRIIICILLGLITVMRAKGIVEFEELEKWSAGSLRDGQLVEVSHSSEISPSDQVKREYYVMKVSHRDKRTAYDNMKTLLERVVFILKRYKVIPHEDSLIKSKTKPKYLNKKRQWEFSAIFVILGNEIELSRCYGQLSRLGIQKLSARPSIYFLNEKARALEVFAGAKGKLQETLKKFPGFEIKQIEAIELFGQNLPHSDLIARQIEEEFSHSEENMEESKLEGQNEESGSGNINLRVVFEVTDQGEEADSMEELNGLLEGDSDEV
jgi:hypothetical protein